jgi:hypothetical protein
MVYSVFICLTTLYGYFYMVRLPWFIVQFSYAVIIFLGALWVMLYGELSRVKPSVRMMLLQMAPLLFALMWSMFVWAFNGDSVAVMKRGIGVISYQLLLLMMIHVAGMMFGPEVIQYTLFGFIAGTRDDPAGRDPPARFWQLHELLYLFHRPHGRRDWPDGGSGGAGPYLRFRRDHYLSAHVLS